MNRKEVRAIMKLSYNTTEPTEIERALAEKVIDLLVASGVTYQSADTVLTTAQALLVETTKPIRV